MEEVQKPQEYDIHGKKLVCRNCHYERFWIRRTTVNTWDLLFQGLDWTNQPAENYICANCGQNNRVLHH